LGHYAQPLIIERRLFRPYWLLRRRAYATVFTSGFVHADLGHLLFSMFTYWFFAFPLERRIASGRSWLSISSAWCAATPALGLSSATTRITHRSGTTT
jgi:membrane associated rhomboid family serine protease